MNTEFYETAIAVRNQLSREDPYYGVKKELLSQMVSACFKNEEQAITNLELKYDFWEFGLIPTNKIVNLAQEIIDAVLTTKLVLRKTVSGPSDSYFLMTFK